MIQEDDASLMIQTSEAGHHYSDSKHSPHSPCPIYRCNFFDIVKETTQQSFKVGLDKLLKQLASVGSLSDDHIRSVSDQLVQ